MAAAATSGPLVRLAAGSAERYVLERDDVSFRSRLLFAHDPCFRGGMLFDALSGRARHPRLVLHQLSCYRPCAELAAELIQDKQPNG